MLTPQPSTVVAVAVVMPPHDHHPVRWWHAHALALLTTTVHALDRHPHGKPRIQIKAGPRSTITAQVATRPAAVAP